MLTSFDMTTVRLSPEFERKLDAISKTRHMSKSDLIKEALEIYFFQREDMKDSYELGKDYFGKYGSGGGKLSAIYKEKIKEKLHAKFCAD
jgi:predicted DNA-binding protein